MVEFVPEFVPANVAPMLRGYLAAAEWLLPEGTKRSRIIAWSGSAVMKARRECDQFREEAVATANSRMVDYLGSYGEEQLGHDFYLSRNGAGAGFFSRKGEFDTLQKIAGSYSTSESYVSFRYIHLT